MGGLSKPEAMDWRFGHQPSLLNPYPPTLVVKPDWPVYFRFDVRYVMSTLYLFSNLKTRVHDNEEDMIRLIARELGVETSDVRDVRVVKESIDARKKPVMLNRNVEFTLNKMPQSLPNRVVVIERSAFDIADPTFFETKIRQPEAPVVVVGAGPAGMFAALALAESGVKTVLLERGKPVDTRMRDIGQLRSHGTLDPESNICFGEGGAGAYTDGKLYTRIKDRAMVRWVYRKFVDFEAPEDILVQAHPHLGTDKLVRIVKRMREYLIERGVEVRFETKVTRVLVKEGAVCGLEVNDGEVIPAKHVILGIGHSARDTLAQLHKDGIALEAKDFAVGVRVEHPQEMINRNQFGKAERDPVLGAAAYSLSYKAADDLLDHRGVYSFCMCPGGFIVPSPTEPDHMAINGMSNANRSTPFANSGVVAQVTVDDLLRRGYQESPLIGISFQRDLEARVFKYTEKAYAAPAMRICDFIARKPTGKLAATNFRPVAEAADLWEVLPEWIAEPLAAGLEHFNRKIRGYTSSEANMLAVESRTSSPIRVLRDTKTLESVSAAGLYPVGEGAGYAGGIVSAAVDGARAAGAVVELLGF